jgi:acetyltransferase
MINQSLIDPSSIVVVGGSGDIEKPGGKILKNLLDGCFGGDLYVVNPKNESVQGIACLHSVAELETAELAIICVPARYCPDIVGTLAGKKKTRAFIILSAGFGEEGEQGRRWEQEIVETVNSVNACLLGPNCIGILNSNYTGIFTSPVPQLDPMGCDLVSSSGATAVFLLEAGILLGLKFSGVYSVGNSAQTGIEEVLEYMDQTYDPERDSSIKLLYLESIANPGKLLKHASSLVRKGARIAAIKAGNTEAGERAAASHTGALANPDMAVRALFKKAGIVSCDSREELLSVASAFNYKPLIGKNIAVITHAGGPAVMLTDALSNGGLNVPLIDGPNAEELLSMLNPGSSVSNPIDFLATGTANQLGTIIDFCDRKFDQVDAMVVIFGSPGLFDVADVYEVLSEKLETCRKPIYPVLPSVINAREGIQAFLAKGHINFPDEVALGSTLAVICKTAAPPEASETDYRVDQARIRNIIDASTDGFLSPAEVAGLLDAAGIPRASETTITTPADIENMSPPGFPIAMKVVGPVHKTDVGGVMLNINSMQELKSGFERLMQIDNAEAVLVQPMIDGVELFAGVKRESNFGHLIVCGLGGIFIEILNDFSSGLAPLTKAESLDMIRSLQGYKVFQGVRGREGVNEELFSEIIQRLSLLVEIAPEIVEMDMNPLMGEANSVVAVDTRVRVLRQSEN